MSRPQALPSCLLAAALIGSSLPAHGALPAHRTTPQPYWREIPGGPGTTCGKGGRFSFWVHGENPRRFLIVLGGGGACWDAATCGTQATTDFTSDLSDFPAKAGLLDPDRTDNPVRGYSVVLIPYCTGDVHLGTRDQTYAAAGDSMGASGTSVVIHHAGRNNARDALKWAFRMVKDPAVIVVAGVGAGAVASPMVGELIAEHYPSCRVIQLGNGSGGFRGASIPGILATWGVPRAMRDSKIYRDLDSTQVTFETLYTAFQKPAANLHTAQINSAADTTTFRFLGRMGAQNPSIPRFLRDNLDEIRQARPEFRAYVLPSERHTILLSPDFYTTTVDSVSLRDWVAGLVEGKAVNDVGLELLHVPEPPVAGALPDSLHAGHGAAVDSSRAGQGAAIDSIPAGQMPADTLRARPPVPTR